MSQTSRTAARCVPRPSTRDSSAISADHSACISASSIVGVTQRLGEKPANVLDDAASAAFQHLLEALLGDPDVGEPVLREVVPQRLLQLSQSLRVIRHLAGMRPVGEDVRSRGAEFAFRLHYTLHLEVKGVRLGGDQATFRPVPGTGFELKLVGKSVPAQGQFAQAFQQRQMLGDMLPALGVGRGIAENANAVQLLLLR